MQRTCANDWCRQSFDVSDADLAFYEKVSPVIGGKTFSIPPPSQCPDCRQQRRVVYRNERNLYRRNCDLCKRQIVSVYPKNAAFPIFCNTCWWSDRWDPLASGTDYDPTQTFLKQWNNLRNRTPQLAIQNDNTAGSENCEYCYDFAFGKNCYLTNCTWHVEEAYYSTSCNFSKFMVDCHMCNEQCELCYECVDCEKIYDCTYLQDSENCTECAFGKDLIGCRNCFGCFGLRHKEFYVFNEPVSPEDYAQHIKEWKSGSYLETEQIKMKFAQWILQFPHKYARIRQCEGCEGNNIYNSKNATGFNVFRVEESKYLDWVQDTKHCYDMLSTGKPEWCLDCVTPDSSFRVLFSNWCWKCNDILYSDNCHSCAYLIGCSGLKHRKYCIFNRQYSPEEYVKRATEILEELIKTSAWGNLFPVESSPFAYNETIALEQFPLTKDEVRSRGWRWAETLPFTTGKETINSADLPDLISEIEDEILTSVLACTACARNFKIIAAELAFYRKMNLPVPRLCPECRHRERSARRLPKKLWNRSCAQCNKPLKTAFAPERPEKVFCESCYLKEVY